MEKNEFKERLAELNNDKATKDVVSENTSLPSEEKDGELPDFIDYIKSEEYIRDGSNSRMPMKVTLNGKDFQVYVRPITSQEYYRLQLDAMNKKESLDLLACQIAMVDKNGNNIDPLLLDNLKAGVIQDISAGIRLISSIDTQGMEYKEIMEYFLKT